LIYYAARADNTVWNTVLTNADHVAVLTDTIKYYADLMSHLQLAILIFHTEL